MTMFDTPVYHPQFTPQSQFAGFPGQYGQFGQFGHQQLGGLMGQPGRFLPFETGWPVPGPFTQSAMFGSQLGALNHPIGSGFPQIGGLTPQVPLGALLGLYGQLLAQGIGGWPGYVPLGAIAPQALQALCSALPYGQLSGHIGWPGQPPIGFLPATYGALPGQYGQQIGWPGQQQFGNPLAGVMGRSLLPYQAAPQIAYAG